MKRIHHQRKAERIYSGQRVIIQGGGTPTPDVVQQVRVSRGRVWLTVATAYGDLRVPVEATRMVARYSWQQW